MLCCVVFYLVLSVLFWYVRGSIFKYIDNVMFFLFCSCCVFWWHVDGQWEQRRSGEMLTKQRCQVSFFSLDVPSVFYLFFALSVLLFLLTASCLCALCTTTYMWTKAGIHRPFSPKREKKVICIFANIFIFHFSKILLFVFLEFFNSNFSLIFQKEEQVVVLSTSHTFEGWIG